MAHSTAVGAGFGPSGGTASTPHLSPQRFDLSERAEDRQRRLRKRAKNFGIGGAVVLALGLAIAFLRPGALLGAPSRDDLTTGVILILLGGTAVLSPLYLWIGGPLLFRSVVLDDQGVHFSAGRRPDVLVRWDAPGARLTLYRHPTGDPPVGEIWQGGALEAGGAHTPVTPALGEALVLAARSKGMRVEVGRIPARRGAPRWETVNIDHPTNPPRRGPLPTPLEALRRLRSTPKDDLSESTGPMGPELPDTRRRLP